MFFTICKILEITNLYELFFGSNEHDPLSFLNDEGKQKVMEYADILIASADAAMKGQQGALLPCLLPGRPPGFETHAPYYVSRVQFVDPSLSHPSRWSRARWPP